MCLYVFMFNEVNGEKGLTGNYVVPPFMISKVYTVYFRIVIHLYIEVEGQVFRANVP